MRTTAARLACILAAAAFALGGAALAGDSFYYRQGGALPAYAVPDLSPDFVPGTGDMRVMGPVEVRARPGVYFSLRLVAVDPSGAVSWQPADGLPEGLSLSADGLVSGYPASVGRKGGIVAAALDGAGRKGATRPFAIDVRPLPSVTVVEATQVPAGGC